MSLTDIVKVAHAALTHLQTAGLNTLKFYQRKQIDVIFKNLFFVLVR